jgi:hypothetical protein
MAITARTIITNPAAAAVAAWTILGVSLLANDISLPVDAKSVCGSELGPTATEYEYLDQMQCLSDSGFLERSYRVGVVAVTAFPTSEALNNQLGIVSIQTERYQEANVILARALQRIRPSNATMENNLVWSSLWAPRLTVQTQRDLYVRALEKEPRLCEALHTGLMVEWRASRAGTSFSRAEAISAFAVLSDRYERCEYGTTPTAYDKLTEDLSVATAMSDIDQMLDVSYNIKTARVINDVSVALGQNEWDAVQTCKKAVPSSIGATDICVRLVTEQAAVAAFQTPRLIRF